MAVSATASVALLSVLALFASGVLGASSPPPGATPSPVTPAGSPPAATAAPSAEPSASPSVQPRVSPSASPNPSLPVDDASDGFALVDLVNWPGVESSALVWDDSGSLATAGSGQPDRSPVDYERVHVSQLGVASIRLTWSDLAIGNQVRVTVGVDETGRYRVSLYRPVPEPPTDGVVSNRVLDLRFQVAVDAGEVDARLLQGLAPSGATGFVQREVTPSNAAGLSLAVWDETEGLSDATIVRVDGPADLEPDILGLENVGDGTVRARWSDPDGFTSARLSIHMLDDGRYQFRLVRERPEAPSLPVALERVVDLHFLVHVVAEDVDVEVVDALANGG